MCGSGFCKKIAWRNGPEREQKREKEKEDRRKEEDTHAIYRADRELLYGYRWGK